jgi:hypothetical protein
LIEAGVFPQPPLAPAADFQHSFRGLQGVSSESQRLEPANPKWASRERLTQSNCFADLFTSKWHNQNCDHDFQIRRHNLSVSVFEMSAIRPAKK